MTEHTGLSQLADAFHEAAAEKFYPIKKRGGRRYLNPNRHAIAWLEKETADAARIVEIIDVYADGLWTGTRWTVAHGWFAAKRNGNYVRPMYELFDLECSSSSMRVYTNPCPACLDLSRSWACEEHSEIPWDDEKKQRDQPPADPYATVRAAVSGATQEAYRRQWEWLPGSPLADAVRQIPDDLAPRIQDRLDWYRARNVPMEVNGETVDGILSFSFEAEGGATHDS